MTAVHVVVPDGIDDPAQPSGGNAYDRRVCRGLTALGWSVREHPVPGSWPRPDAAARAGLARAMAELPDGAVVLVDGLIASTAPEVLVPESARLRLVVLVHMPLGRDCVGAEVAGARERSVLSAAAAVVTTSAWTRSWLLDRYALRPAQVHVAEPGVEAAELAPGTASGGELLCVAAVIPGKGHDVLLEALTEIVDLPWRCVCVGALTRDPGFVNRLGRQARDGGISDRVLLAGPRTGADLDAAYAAADALVLASRAETYAMVVTEALARGLPVVATNVGGLPQALGRGADGSRPGLLVPPDDPAALAAALRRWLGDTSTRRRFREVAHERRGVLPAWSSTALRVSQVLAEVAP
ncbi:glycosyltransferase family 4 protein [Pengzhenrongella sp.]|jgi:glycosyltransferase involved in cell wall biosynthesis|uniref:glycosyltransferase family 4 protein n=1 Tax=Pengzhenrongella sp. TaxID=2888820 RepID=UPI002F930A8E